MKKILILLIALPFMAVSCQTGSKEIACAYNGDRYNPGETFTAEDGCNTCSCGQDGSIACTEIACEPVAPIDECTTDADCLSQGIDLSFCEAGAWKCINSMCEYQCSIN